VFDASFAFPIFDVYYGVAQQFELFGESVGRCTFHQRVEHHNLLYPCVGPMSCPPVIDERFLVVILKHDSGVVVDVYSSLVFLGNSGFDSLGVGNAPVGEFDGLGEVAQGGFRWFFRSAKSGLNGIAVEDSEGF
jgi:hypothetical protein